MRNGLARCLTGLCLLTTGCQLAHNAVGNLTYEAKLAAAELQDHVRYHKLAKMHWDQVRNAEPNVCASKDYEAGFMEGFTDYVEYGGTGQPPYLPPRCYWGPHYRTPEGYAAVEEWFAGFRHGSAVGQQSGYRQFSTVPSVLSTAPPADGVQLNFDEQLTQSRTPSKAAPVAKNTPAPLPRAAATPIAQKATPEAKSLPAFVPPVPEPIVQTKATQEVPGIPNAMMRLTASPVPEKARPIPKSLPAYVPPVTEFLDPNRAAPEAKDFPDSVPPLTFRPVLDGAAPTTRRLPDSLPRQLPEPMKAPAAVDRRSDTSRTPPQSLSADLSEPEAVAPVPAYSPARLRRPFLKPE